MGGVGSPGSAGDVGETGIEEVLAVVEIEDGKAAGGLVVILWGEVDGDGALLGDGEKLGVELPDLKSGFGLKIGIGREVVVERADEVVGEGRGLGVGPRWGGWCGGAVRLRLVQFQGGTPMR